MIFSFGLPSFEIVLLFIDAIFINSVAERHVSSASEILVGVCLASLVCVCLYGGSDTIWHSFVVLSPGAWIPIHNTDQGVCLCSDSYCACVFTSDNNVKGMPHCSTNAPCCHIHLSHGAAHALHTHHTWVPREAAKAHVHKVAYLRRSLSRGHWENRSMLDVGLKAESGRLYASRKVVESFANNHKTMSEVFQWQLNGPGTSLSVLTCQGL